MHWPAPAPGRAFSWGGSCATSLVRAPSRLLSRPSPRAPRRALSSRASSTASSARSPPSADTRRRAADGGRTSHPASGTASSSRFLIAVMRSRATGNPRAAPKIARQCSWIAVTRSFSWPAMKDSISSLGVNWESASSSRQLTWTDRPAAAGGRAYRGRCPGPFSRAAWMTGESRITAASTGPRSGSVAWNVFRSEHRLRAGGDLGTGHDLHFQYQDRGLPLSICT
jgi:hypothetical protein